MAGPHCVTCQRELEPHEQVYIEIRGWEKPGRGLYGNSGSSLVLRKPTGRVRCRQCVTDEIYGVTPDQLKLA